MPHKNGATTPPPAPTTEGEPRTGDSDADEDAPIEAWKLIVAVVGIFIALTVAGLLAVTLFGGGDDDGGGAADTAITDDFDRPDSASTLGTTPSGIPWESVSGTWGISAGQAYLSEVNAEGQRSLATIDMGSPNGSVEVQAATMTNGWGIVFRYVGQFNYWYISASPEFATYNITKIIDGSTVQVSKIGLAPTADGSTLRVQFRGPSIDVYIDDKLMTTLSDTSLAQATRVGLLAAGEQPLSARWAAFVAEPDFSAAAGAGTPQGGVVPPPTAAPTVDATTIPVPAPDPDATTPADGDEGG